MTEIGGAGQSQALPSEVLATRLLQHPASYRKDQPSILRDRYETIGTHKPLPGKFQRSNASTPTIRASVGIHARLVIQFELLMLQRLGQPTLYSLPLG